MSSNKSSIAVVGLWHLGCTLSGCWSDLGHDVVGFDANPKILANLKNGVPPIFEPGLEDLLKKNMKAGRLKIADGVDGISGCDFVFLSYDTPVLDNDESDLKPLENTIRSFQSVLKNGAVVIVSSQMPAGTCEKFRKILKEKNASLELVYSPENIRLGQAMQSYMKPGRIILGSADRAAEGKVKKLFSEIDGEILSMNLTSSEMVKHGINSFLAMSITFTNHLADLCEATGADVLDVIRGLKSDPRIGQQAYLTPGIGFSGGTLGRDLKVLSHLNEDSKAGADLFAKIYDFNQERKKNILGKVKKILGTGLRQKKIGVLGLTYKPGTSTLRRSLPAEIVKLIAGEGAEVQVFDPKADYNEWEGEKKFKTAASFGDAVSGSDLVLLLTEWPEFKDAPWKKFYNASQPQAVLDTKNFLADLKLSEIGFKYVGMGRQN